LLYGSALTLFLESYRFKPEQVIITFIPMEEDPNKGQIAMEANGPWLEIILYEIPLMSLLSEIYFITVDKTWMHEDQEERAYRKGKRLLEVGCTFSEFGTRRRRSYKVQDNVVAGLIRADKEESSHTRGGRLFGTSNVKAPHFICMTADGII
jgi:nicotinate phosphoribosyltransferase